MADRELTLKMIVQAIDRVTKPARQMGAAMGDMARRARLDQLQAKLMAARERLTAIGTAARNVGKRFQDFGAGALTKVTAPLALVGGFALNAYGKIEQLTTSFKSMLGGADAARAMVKKLTDFAASTPFQLEGIGQSAKQLLAFGVLQDNIVPVLRNLGDIAAGANIPLNEMAAIYGKVKAKGKAMTEELLQLSDRGIPVIDVLAKGLGKSKDQIFELASQGRISFDILKRAMQTMTAQGGIFFQQMEEQSKTLFGKLSTLKDNVFLLFADLGETLDKMFGVKDGIDVLISKVQLLRTSFVAFSESNPGLAKLVAFVGILAAAIGPLAIGIGLAASAFGVLATGLGLIFSPIGLVIAAFAGAAFLIIKHWDEVQSFLAKVAITIVRAWAPIGNFFSGLWDGIKAGFDEGFIQGVLKVLETFNPAIWILKGANELIKALFGIDLAKIGSEWIGGLWSGMQAKWAELVQWLSSSVTSLMDWMPDWVKERMGLDGGGLGQMPSGVGNAASAIAPAIGPQNGQTRVGGEIKVSFDNAPSNMKIKEVKSDNPDVVPSVYAGYAMGGS
ncbi:tape measure protein [Thalassospira alkalitolerans]|uniref:tape measure protein n=1 Tax=Thalassospira alkalitolerans TaxID=1293890 RepID=UPI0030EE838D|tara:strand:+ start:16165 stop:17850 length:1686 start_codon:yes stop_codon:yes gene_type:complete